MKTCTTWVVLDTMFKQVNLYIKFSHWCA